MSVGQSRFGQSRSNKDGQSRSNFSGQSRFGQSRIWPKWANKDGQSRIGQSRLQPYRRVTSHLEVDANDGMRCDQFLQDWQQQNNPAVEKGTAPFQCALTTRAGVECVAHVIQTLTDLDHQSTVMSVDGFESCHVGGTAGH